MNLKDYLLSIVAILIIVILPHSGLIPVPFAYSIPILLFIWLYLKHYRLNFSDIGFDLKSFNLKSLFIGGLIAIVIFCFLQFIFFPILNSFIQFDEVYVELYNQIRGNTGFYIFILIMGWFIGGIYEEIVFHGFIFSRLEKMLPGKFASVIAFLFTSLLFGLYHIQLGAADTINAILAGAGYLALVLYYKRNLWYGIFCHAIYDTIVITLLYLGYL